LQKKSFLECKNSIDLVDETTEWSLSLLKEIPMEQKHLTLFAGTVLRSVRY